jgi:hypothetical protein
MHRQEDGHFCHFSRQTARPEVSNGRTCFAGVITRLACISNHRAWLITHRDEDIPQDDFVTKAFAFVIIGLAAGCQHGKSFENLRRLR